MRQYVVCGRHEPTSTHPDPEICRMTIFAPNTVVAQSRFWHYMRSLKSYKKAHGQIISVTEVPESGKVCAKNFGFWIRYRSLKGVHNMYKEYRDTSVTHAAERLFNDMAGQYKVKYASVDIIKVARLKDEECKRPATKMFHKASVMFPQTFALAPYKGARGCPFKYHRPRMAL